MWAGCYLEGPCHRAPRSSYKLIHFNNSSCSHLQQHVPHSQSSSKFLLLQMEVPLGVATPRCVIGRCVPIQRLRRVSRLPLPKPRSDNTSPPSNMKIHAEITGPSKEDGLLIRSYTRCAGKTRYVWMDGWMLNTHLRVSKIKVALGFCRLNSGHTLSPLQRIKVRSWPEWFTAEKRRRTSSLNSAGRSRPHDRSRKCSERQAVTDSLLSEPKRWEQMLEGRLLLAPSWTPPALSPLLEQITKKPLRASFTICIFNILFFLSELSRGTVLCLLCRH